MVYPTYPGQGFQAFSPGQPVLDQFRQNQLQQMPFQGVQAQPQQMTMAQPPQTAPQYGGINWVGSKAEADAWPIAPGCAVALWDSNNPVIYLRQADSTGKPSTKVYDLVERLENQSSPQLSPDKYVTWDKLEEYIADRLKKSAGGRQKKEDTENG